jgi:His/Glu/Gln/Arg/opine family amino acid ABC transporter permease subunit
MPRALAAAALALALVAGFVGFARPARADDAVLVVGLTGRYPPFNSFDDQGELVGFDVDFAREVCRQIGRRCEFRTLQWDGIVGALLAGRVDAIIGSMAVTPERSRSVRFSAPYYESGAQLFVRPGGRGPAAAGFAVGVTLGTTYERAVRERFPAADVRVYKGDVEVLQDLAAGRLDGLVTDRWVGAYMAKKFGVPLERSGALLYEERIAIPVAPKNEALLAAIDGAVGRIRASPRYAELMARHFGENAKVAGQAEIGAMATRLLLRGLLATIAVCVVGLGLGIVASVAVAAALLAGGRLARPLALVVDFIRATPFMVQLFAIYFGLPSIGLHVGAWTSAVVAIAIHSAAYLGELLKTAYESVPRGQHDAARALGLGRFETLRHVLVPQMLPALTVPALSTIVAMIKDSAIVSVIGVYELTLQAQEIISATFRPMTFYVAAALLYFVVTYPILLAGRGLERRFRARGLLHG